MPETLTIRPRFRSDTVATAPYNGQPFTIVEELGNHHYRIQFADGATFDVHGWCVFKSDRVVCGGLDLENLYKGYDKRNDYAHIIDYVLADPERRRKAGY